MTNVPRLRAALLAWYDRCRRDLPWRARPGEIADPYRVWLSEVMLQQTTTVHAAPYFQAFTARWPTVADLAAARDEEVMAAWAGLGYYARARNLLACARAVAQRHGGTFPRDETALRALPGLGPYTTAAVTAIAFDRPANVVDGNVERVMARLFAVEAPLPAAKPQLRDLAAGLVRADRPGDWAQALMDLGATVCRPRGPSCEACPWREDCAARATGDPGAYPRRSPKAQRPHRLGVAFRLTCRGDVALVRRPEKGLLGGMLALPSTDWTPEGPDADTIDAAAPCPGAWGEAGAVDHVFTHFSLRLRVLALETPRRPPRQDLIWLPASEARASAPTLFAKALEA